MRSLIPVLNGGHRKAPLFVPKEEVMADVAGLIPGESFLGLYLHYLFRHMVQLDIYPISGSLVRLHAALLVKRAISIFSWNLNRGEPFLILEDLHTISKNSWVARWMSPLYPCYGNRFEGGLSGRRYLYERRPVAFSGHGRIHKKD